MTNFLHIHGQPIYHSPAKIIGTRDSLEQLHKLLSKIVGETKSTNSNSGTFTVIDGEEFELEVVLVPDAKDPAMDVLPYYDLPWDKESV